MRYPYQAERMQNMKYPARAGLKGKDAIHRLETRTVRDFPVQKDRCRFPLQNSVAGLGPRRLAYSGSVRIGRYV